MAGQHRPCVGARATGKRRQLGRRFRITAKRVGQVALAVWPRQIANATHKCDSECQVLWPLLRPPARLVGLAIVIHAEHAPVLSATEARELRGQPRRAVAEADLAELLLAALA